MTGSPIPPAAAAMSPAAGVSRGPDLAPVRPGASDAALREAAQAFEAAFLAEMLKHSGLGEAPEGFGGGAGEEQFAGHLRAAQARTIAESGGLGLAEHIFEALKERRDD